MEPEQQQSSDGKRKNVVHRRKWLTLEEKLKIINANDNGKTSGQIAREHGMNESSVRLILRKKAFYKSLGQSQTFHKWKSFAQQRSSLLGKVEHQLFVWMDEEKQKKRNLAEAHIQKKALDIFNELKPKYRVTSNFSASRRWLRGFKNRMYVQKCIQSMGALPTTEESAQQFRLEFQKLIHEDGYTYHQIFNVEETVMYWKKIPCSAFESDFEKNQPSKEKVCLLLGSNATGDFKLRPLVINRSETLLALTDFEKDSLPFMWRWNKKSWLTQELFQEWFTCYFCPAVEQYCKDHGLEFKVLLVLDPTCSHNIIRPDPNVKILFLPKHISKLIQPMSLGIFPLLKMQYQRLISQNIATLADRQNFSFDFNIKNAIENIYSCWADTNAENLAAGWHKLLPDVKAKDFESQTAAVAREIMNIDQQLGITDIQNFQNYSDFSTCETSDQFPKFEEVILDTDVVHENGYDEDTIAEDLKTIVQNIDTACEIIMMTDSDLERSIKARQCLQEGIRCYRDLYLERTKQKTNNENTDI